MKRIYIAFCLVFSQLFLISLNAQTVRLDATVKHQQITGFGAFVCSPTFTYNHMTTADIKKVWGEESTVGCNIMRLYIPIGKNAWSQSLQTAKTAKQLGLILFASPWGQPAEWKTNGTSNAKNSDGTTGKLKRENWADYAKYLDDYVNYLRQNGVELEAISIQNEPDWPAQYAGCLWSAQEIAEFVKTYGPSISCKVMAPETLAVSDSYANELNKDDVLPAFDIYGGHQYGGIQTGYKKLAAKGKQLWMTEYLINWNENAETTRNFDYHKDVFDFFRAINTCMLGDFNAWVHYAAKRFYGLLGDGQYGTNNGSVTKRGCVMAHFARFVTGMTRIDANFGTTGLDGSAFLSEKGDTAVVVMANQSEKDIDLTVDLPFYTLSEDVYTTTKSRNFLSKTFALEEEDCRPKVNVPAESVVTAIFVRSKDRQHSDMVAKVSRFDRIDDMTTTVSRFGSAYKLSGATRTFDHSNPLISTRTNSNLGYVKLSDRFSHLVMEVKKVTSTMNYNSSNTTLIYINAKGQLATHNYGEIDWSKRENFNVVLDLSPETLTDGCTGLISLTNGNYSSVLTITFGDVYLGNDYAAHMSGDFVADDSYVLDFSSDKYCTSLELSSVNNLPPSLAWMEGSNRILYTGTGTSLDGANVVSGGQCPKLALSEEGGDFRPYKPFTANEASFTCNVDGMKMIMLPFNAVIPDGAYAYIISEDMKLVMMRSIPANTPVVVEGQGELVFTSNGAEIEYVASPVDNVIRGSYAESQLFVGDFVLGQSNGQWGFVRLKTPATLQPFGCYAAFDTTDDFIPLDMKETAIKQYADTSDSHYILYDVTGRVVDGCNMPNANSRNTILIQHYKNGTVRKFIVR